MADATVKHIDEMESFYDGMVVRARAELGVTSWGMQVFNVPPGFDQYPDHHHCEGAIDPGQEELYIPLAGSADLLLNGEQHGLARSVGAGRDLTAAADRARQRRAPVPRHRRCSRQDLRATCMDRARRRAPDDAGLG